MRPLDAVEVAPMCAPVCESAKGFDPCMSVPEGFLEALYTSFLKKVSHDFTRVLFKVFDRFDLVPVSFRLRPGEGRD